MSEGLDLSALERNLHLLSNPSTPAAQRAVVNEELTSIKNNPESYKFIPQILTNEGFSLSTKFFALSILQDTINFRWNSLPVDEKAGLKNFIVSQILQTSSNTHSSSILNKFNLVLVDVLKQDWPENWPNFLPELISSSTNSESLCLNNLKILKLLSEEVFSFSKDKMTQSRTKFLKSQLETQFQQIFELLNLVLTNAGNIELITAALKTLLNYMEWIDRRFIFETELIQTLQKFLSNAKTRLDALACFREIGSLDNTEKYFPQIQQVFVLVIENLRQHGGEGVNLSQGVAMFLDGILGKNFIQLEASNQQEVIYALEILITITQTDEKELLRICVEFWSVFAETLFKRNRQFFVANSSVNLYAKILHDLRQALIPRMAKPSEVLIIEDDDGSIVRETNKDTQDLAMYKLMRETLVYLCHLNPKDTETIMLEILSSQFPNKGGFSWQSLNTLCWAAGSISGAMSEVAEKSFLVTVIKDLLSLVELKRGKDNKAVVASNIMYVVGQYPRFLRAHWKFLKTVVNKLFEFMQELHPGVQDMACDTFLTISKSCQHQFIQLQVGELEPFIATLIVNLPAITSQLQPHQTITFYESCSAILTSEAANQQLITSLMNNINQEFNKLLADSANLNSLQTVKTLLFILKINVAVSTTLKQRFSAQFGQIFLSLVQLYGHYTDMANNTPHNVHEFLFKSIRSLKTQIISLCSLFIENGSPAGSVLEAINVFSEPLLKDYGSSAPQEKLPLVLNFFAIVLEKNNAELEGIIPAVFGNVVKQCLELITQNFTDFPDHRLNYYRLVKALVFNNENFKRLFLDGEHIDLTVKSILWAIKHTDRRVAEKGLEILATLIYNVCAFSQSDQEIKGAFWEKYYMSILKDVLEVLTDRLHKSSFKMHCVVLKHLILGIQTGSISNINRDTLHGQICQLIATEFSNVGKTVVQEFVSHMFELSKNGQEEFKEHMRDFLIKLKEFSNDGDDNDKLFSDEQERQRREQMREKAMVPGLLTQKEKDELDDL